MHQQKPIHPSDRYNRLDQQREETEHMATKPLNIALLGAGDWGKNLLRVFDDLANVKYCLYGGSGETRRWLKNNHPHVERTTDYELILDDTDVDAVAIATPNSTHRKFAQEALEADKHVFVEKPFVTFGEDARPLVRVAEARDRTLFIGYIFLYHEVFDHLLNWDNEFVSITHDWRKTGSFGVSLVENLVCHEVAISKCLIDRNIRDVQIIEKTGRDSRVDILTAKLCYLDSRESIINTNRLSPEKHKYLILFDEKENVLVWEEERLFRFDPDENRFDEIFQASEEPLMREVEAFLQSVSSGSPSQSGGRFSIEVNSIVQRIQQLCSDNRA